VVLAEAWEFDGGSSLSPEEDSIFAMPRGSEKVGLVVPSSQI
jgi:hypothetical protein